MQKTEEKLWGPQSLPTLVSSLIDLMGARRRARPDRTPGGPNTWTLTHLSPLDPNLSPFEVPGFEP